MDILDRFFDASTSYGKLAAFSIVFIASAITGATIFLILWGVIAAFGVVTLSAGISGAIGCGIGSAICPAIVAAIHA